MRVPRLSQALRIALTQLDFIKSELGDYTDLTQDDMCDHAYFAGQITLVENALIDMLETINHENTDIDTIIEELDMSGIVDAP